MFAEYLIFFSAFSHSEDINKAIYLSNIKIITLEDVFNDLSSLGNGTNPNLDLITPILPNNCRYSLA